MRLRRRKTNQVPFATIENSFSAYLCGAYMNLAKSKSVPLLYAKYSIFYMRTEQSQENMSNQLVAIIPARMGSSRFPGKPLASLLGRPMIEHVIRRAEMCSQLDGVYVATCDEAIKQVVENFGGRVIMPSATHERSADRTAEASEQIKAEI